MISCI